VIRIGRLRRDRGISVARPTVLGNPFVRGEDGTREEVVAKYREFFAVELRRNQAVRAAGDRIVEQARKGDVTLLCWCAPEVCHAEVIAEEVRRRLEPDDAPPTA